MAFTLGITLLTVEKMVKNAHFIVEFPQILNQRSPGNDPQHLHAAAQSQHGNIVVQAIGHREVFRHVTRRIGGTVVKDAMPRLGHGKQRRADVTAAQENNRLHTGQQFVGIGAMIGVTLDDIGIFLT